MLLPLRQFLVLLLDGPIEFIEAHALLEEQALASAQKQLLHLALESPERVLGDERRNLPLPALVPLRFLLTRGGSVQLELARKLLGQSVGVRADKCLQRRFDVVRNLPGAVNVGVRFGP